MKRRSEIVTRAYTYTIILEPQEEGGFTVLVPALPEVVTEGDTAEEAMAMAKEAIELALEYRQEQGFDIPVDTKEEVQVRKVEIAVAV
jgi:antitoxin HicB